MENLSQPDRVDDLRELLDHKLANWPAGDLRSAVVYVRPAQQMLDIHPSWRDQRIAIYPANLKEHRFPKLNSQNSIDKAIQGVQAIAANSCFGQVSITPRRRATSVNGQVYFEVVWTVSFHTKIDAMAA
jgi:hypothetical protein